MFKKLTDEFKEDTNTYARLFVRVPPRCNMPIKTMSDKPVYRYTMEKLLSDGHVVVETNFDSKKIPENRK